MRGARAESGAAAGRRWKGLAVLAMLALLLHAGALSGIDWAWPQRAPAPQPASPMQVRALANAPAAPAEVRLEPAPTLAVAAPAAPRPAVRQVAAAAPPDSPVVPAVTKAAALPAPAEAPLAELATPLSEESIPHYRTRLPPAVTLRYDMLRGRYQGNGELQWRPGADRYELRLEGRVAGLTVLTQLSQGGFDEDGIAPLRFTDRRLRRGLAAANFQREAGTITFSGPSSVYPLHAGAQDRLSWMIQLGAIVAAEPALGMPGAKIVVFVSGAHGDAGVWAFRCMGPDAVQSRAGSVAAIRFLREPRGPYDTTVEVWLDPQRHHLPVRAQLRAGSNDNSFDLRLQDMLTPP